MAKFQTEMPTETSDIVLRPILGPKSQTDKLWVLGVFTQSIPHILYIILFVLMRETKVSNTVFRKSHWPARDRLQKFPNPIYERKTLTEGYTMSTLCVDN